MTNIRATAIEAAARAMCRVSGWPDDMFDAPSAYSTADAARDAYVAWATAALDAILAVLSDPSEEMADAGYHADVYDAGPSTIFRAMLGTVAEG